MFLGLRVSLGIWGEREEGEVRRKMRPAWDREKVGQGGVNGVKGKGLLASNGHFWGGKGNLEGRGGANKCSARKSEKREGGECLPTFGG